MVLTEKEREIAWRRTGKGRGNRWLMLRDIMAFLSLQWMNLTILQDTMMRHKGLSRSKVIEMLEQLTRAGDVIPVSGQLDGMVVSGFAASDKGVKYWIGKRTAIPVGLAEEASRNRPVIKYAGSKNE